MVVNVAVVAVGVGVLIAGSRCDSDIYIYSG